MKDFINENSLFIELGTKYLTDIIPIHCYNISEGYRELYSHFQIRILKLSDMVAHDQGHIHTTWWRWSLGTSKLESKDCAGYIVPAASPFENEASRALRNPIGPQGPLGQSLWVRGTPFNEGN